jgi:ACT domain-containing protein
VRPAGPIRPSRIGSDLVVGPSPSRRGPETRRSHRLRTVAHVDDDEVTTYVLRLWLPDRPGALGQVASHIGAVRGDVVGIDILERDGGQAVDELVVELPDAALVGTLLREVGQVEGVRVEEVRPLVEAHDPRLDALEAAAQLVGAGDVVELHDELVVQVRRVVGAAWVVLVDLDPHGQGMLARSGDAPTVAWLHAFLAGSADMAPNTVIWPAPDLAWVPMPAALLALVAGRNRSGFRAKERHQLAAFARVADTRHRELARAASRARHPSLGRVGLTPR